MRIEKTETGGFSPAIRGMRNPMDSWHRSNSYVSDGVFTLCDADKILSQKLTKAGAEHCKHLRMIHAWVDMTLPRYVWSEFDTYIFNTKVSCSTMHKVLSKPLTQNDFEDEVSESYLTDINLLIESAKDTKGDIKNAILRKVKCELKESFLQKRTLDLNYAELLNIYYQRRAHKLPEWHEICDWILELPHFKELTGLE